jgi:hypothetical protein
MTCLFHIFGNEEQTQTHRPIEYRIVVSRNECASGKVDGRLRPVVPLPQPFPVLVLRINDNDLEEQDQFIFKCQSLNKITIKFAGPTSKPKRNDDSKQIASWFANAAST